MLGGNAEVEAHNEEDYFRKMSPVDQLKFERELATKREYTPAEASKNIEDALTGLAYSTPGVANALSIRDAYEAKERAGKAEPGSRERQQAEAESAMSALSAFLPFSLGKPSPGSASRFGVFAGPAAKTADQDALALAQRMERAGASRDEIIDVTNWFKDVDGKWKFEIDDSAATVNLTPNMKNVSEAVNHPELFTAYPQLADVPLRVRGGPGSGAYAGSFDNKFGNNISIGPSDVVKNKSVMHHELQHAIQDIEGFSPGASPAFGHARKDVERAARQAYEESAGDNAILRELGLNVPDDPPLKPWDDLTQRQQLEWYDRGRQRLYYQAAGEQEARNVENRLNMPMSERRAKRPWETQDIPDEQKIVSTERPLRQEVFVPVKDEAAITKSRNIFDDLADEIGPDEANKRLYEDTETWFGPEGTLLREIRDNPGMEVKGEFKAGKSYDITEVIDHPELFKEYPELKNTKVRFLDTPQDPRADRYTGSDPKTGEIMIDESFQGNDLRVQLAKLLQYKVNAKEHRINAAREGPNTKIADSNMAIENTERAIADGLIDEASGREYIRMLQGTLEEGRAVRHDSVVTPGSYAERRGGHAPGTELVHKQRRALESKFWTEKSAGKQEIKAVKTRAYDPERTGFPYGERPRMAGAAVIPHPGTTGEYLKTFIENWKRYGAGRSKK